MSASDCNKR